MNFVLVALLAPASLAIDPTTQPAVHPRSYSTGFTLVRGGVPCTIVRPADAAWQALADELARAVERLAGKGAPVRTDTDVILERLGQLPADLRDTPLIILGDLNANRAVFPLYANYYTYCDAVYPGGDGYVLQTIVRPFGRPTNILLVGGSTLEGVKTGITELVTRLARIAPDEEVELPYCLDVRLAPQWQSTFAPLVQTVAAQDAAATTAPESLPPDAIEYGDAGNRFTSSAHLYFYTGSLVAARQARAWALHLANRDTTGMRIADYTMENLTAAWRRVSPAPVFTTEERRLIDTRLCQTAYFHANSWWRLKGAHPEIGGRHHTTGMLAWWTLIRNLLELAEPDEATRTQLLGWRAEAEGYLDGLLRHYFDDLDDYQSADSVQNTCSYALQTGKLEWFHNGLARRAVQKVLALTDNVGWYAGVQGYGEALAGWERFTLNGGLLFGSCGFVYQDGGYAWLLQHYPALQASWGALQPWGLHQYAAGDSIRPEPPAWLTHLQVLRLTPYRLDLMNNGAFLHSPLMDGFFVSGLRPSAVSAEAAFDKAVHRGGHGADDVYWLLQGMSGIALSTIDMNSIVRYTDQGKLWLVHNTGRRSLFFKNAVYVSSGLNEETLPAACELVAHADFPGAALVSSRLPDGRGTDWTRNVISVGNAFTAVIDQVRANKPGEFTVSCNWRTPGWAAHDDAGW
ncbi:MAG: hypothetical protein HY718_08365, partial [Planctomycetes bacterium]|nr:hypothetical protein [Planctomycetota bacterium]